MKLVVAPPREGIAWVRRAFQVFFRQPLGYASLFAACALVFFVLLRVPLVGMPVFLVVAPTGSLLFMIAARLGVAGERPVPGAFVELAATDRPRVVRMLKLGLAYLVAASIAVGVTSWVEGGAMAAFLEAASNPNASPDAAAAQLANPRLQTGIVLRFVFGAILSIPFWHAPALVYWGGQAWAKALFFSTVAIWRNKAAFTLYGLVWAMLGALFMLLLGVVVALAGSEIATYIVTPLLLLFTTVLYVSLWFTFVGCFSDGAASPTPASA